MGLGWQGKDGKKEKAGTARRAVLRKNSTESPVVGDAVEFGLSLSMLNAVVERSRD